MAILTLLSTNFTLTTLCLLVCVIITWVRYVNSHYTVFKRLGIPGPPPVFLLGNSPAFAKKFPMEVFKDWAKEYGHVFGFYEGLRPSVVVSCPKMAHQILVKHFNIFSTRPVINPFKHEYQDLSLQNVSGPLWKRQRQAVSGGLTAKSIRQMFPVMCDVTNQLITLFELNTENNSEGFYIDDVIERYSLDWFARAALGYHSDALTNENNLQLRYMRASHQSMSVDNPLSGVAKLFPILTPLLKPFDWPHKEVSRLQTDDVKKFLNSIQSKLGEGSNFVSRNIIFNLLTRRVPVADGATSTVTPPHAKSQLNENEIIGEVSGLIGGGVGPISAALTFCIYNLAVHEKEQRSLTEELESIAECKHSVTVDELTKLEAMERFVNETLRIFPVAPGVSRECLEDCIIDGVHFTKGMVVRVMGSTIYSREDLFHRAEDFLPDRFKPENLVKTQTELFLPTVNQSTALMSFGLGPRMCVGQRLALVALKLALARLLQEFQITVSQVTQTPLQVALRPFLVAREGVHIKMIQRKLH
ncbi:unnamed protein product [Lymnaea stagnalis]|uniref:Cytochrome P450 n=1 Tax=Lymnaea stagnalis TaxID=6523 RepID=A0AAV2H9H5_LYMST